MSESDAARPTPPAGRIGKQIVLPWTKAIEIAVKSIRVRFWRSMITMSSIILAIAFLMAIWTSTAITASLKVRPQRDIDIVKEKLGVVGRTVDGAPGALSLDEVKSRFARDVRYALAWNDDVIDDKQDELEDAVGDDARKLEEEIEKRRAKAEPENHVELLHEYLKWRRDELEETKGDLDDQLQREGALSGEETAPSAGPGGPQGADAREPARAAAGGFVTDFLLQMKPTDTWLAILALLVCLVGITNAMFMTVQERFREIGTMKCLGALDGFIVKLFLLESSALGFIGTLLGILVGMLLSSIRQLIVYHRPVLTYFPKGNIALAGALAAAIGLLLSIGAAIFPATKAARMEPVEAMRVEE